jgi:hypothetical protein
MPGVSNPIGRAWSGYRRLKGSKRTPSGSPTGGPLALWVDYLRGLGSGSLGYWTVLLGPYVILLALRVSGRLLKR